MHTIFLIHWSVSKICLAACINRSLGRLTQAPASCRALLADLMNTLGCCLVTRFDAGLLFVRYGKDGAKLKSSCVAEAQSDLDLQSSETVF